MSDEYYEADGSEKLSLWDAADIYMCSGFDEDYRIGYSHEELMGEIEKNTLDLGFNPWDAEARDAYFRDPDDSNKDTITATIVAGAAVVGVIMAVKNAPRIKNWWNDKVLPRIKKKKSDSICEEQE